MGVMTTAFQVEALQFIYDLNSQFKQIDLNHEANRKAIQNLVDLHCSVKEDGFRTKHKLVKLGYNIDQEMLNKERPTVSAGLHAKRLEVGGKTSNKQVSMDYRQQSSSDQQSTSVLLQRMVQQEITRNDQELLGDIAATGTHNGTLQGPSI